MALLAALLLFPCALHAHGIPPLLQSFSGNFTFSSNPTGTYARHAEFTGTISVSVHDGLAKEVHNLADGSIDLLLNRHGADGRVYHYKKNATTGVERCRVADAPRAPKVGVINPPKLWLSFPT